MPTNAYSTGEIFYKNRKLTKKYIESIRGKEIAFIPQSVNSLDAITQTSIFKELISICKVRKIGLLIISHEAKILENLCSRIIKF